MSHDPDDPLPPRRPRPRPKSKPASGVPDPGDNVWQPAAANPGGGKARPAGGSARNLDQPKAYAGKGPGMFERVVFGSIGAGMLAAFCRQLASYLNAGFDLLKALASLEMQFSKTALGPVLRRMQLAVRRGEPLADAMAREPQAFDTFFLSMIRVAEARGGVPETLKALSKHYEARQTLIRQARSAMIYPVIVLVIAAGVIALLTRFLLPMFASLLRDLAGRGGGGELPLPSRVLMAFSDYMQAAGWWMVPLVVVGGAFALFRFYGTPAGKAMLDPLAMRMPVLGALLRKLDTTRFARTLSALLEGGVDVGPSLDLTADVLHLAPFRRAVRDARVDVMKGAEISESIDEAGVFGHDVIAVIQSGEEVGTLPEALDRLADDYEEQVTYMVKNLGNLIQPLLMIFLGGIVLFIILAVILPYIAMISSLGSP